MIPEVSGQVVRRLYLRSSRKEAVKTSNYSPAKDFLKYTVRIRLRNLYAGGFRPHLTCKVGCPNDNPKCITLTA